MTKRRAVTLAFTLAMAGAAGLLFLGCEIDSAESGYRDVEISVAGYYKHPDPGACLVGKNSGAPVCAMDLRQTGDSLEGIDNNGYIFRGTIGDVNGSVASFTLYGTTTVGQEATMSGTIEATTDFKGVMRGTWIEPNIYSTVYGVATIPSNETATADLQISPSSATLTTNTQTQVFTVTGGNGSYSWSKDNANGTLNTTSGGSVTYTRTSAGNNTIRCSDTAGKTDSAEVSQP